MFSFRCVLKPNNFISSCSFLTWLNIVNITFEIYCIISIANSCENMDSDHKYYVPVKVEDGSLRFVADKATELLEHNFRLECIFQKYNEAYNTTLKERYSAKTLQVMNQNRKPIFSSITPTGLIRSPIRSSFSAKKNANNQLRTPLKKNKIFLGTERKRLSFDDVEKDGAKLDHSFPQTCNDNQLLVISSNKNVSPNRFIADEIDTTKHPNTNPLFCNSSSDSSSMYIPERFNLDGKPETITSLSVYVSDTVYSCNETPEKNQTIPERKLFNFNIDETRGSHLKISELISSSERKDKVTDSPDAYIQEVFKLEGKPGNITIHDKDAPCLSTKTPYKHQGMVTSFEKNVTPEKITADTKSPKHIVISPSFFSSEEQTKVSYEPNTNNQESFRSDKKLELARNLFTKYKEVEMPETSPRLSTEHKGFEKPETSPRLSTEHKDTEKPETSPRLGTEHKDVDKPETSSLSTRHKGFEKLETSPNMSTEQKESERPETSPRLSTEQKESERPETSPSLSIVRKEVISMSYKTPDKFKAMFDSVNKKERTPMKLNGVKRVIVQTPSNEHKFLSPMINMETPNNTKVNKRKSVDYSEEIVMNSCLVAEDQVSAGPPKIAKLDDGIATDDKKTVDPTNSMNNKDSFNRANGSTMADKDFFNSVDNSAMDSKVSFNSIGNSAKADKVSFSLVDDSVMDDKESLNPTDNSVMNHKKSLNPTDDFDMNDKDSLNSVDDSTMDCKISFNSIGNSTTDDKVSSDSAMNDISAVPPTNIDMHAITSESHIKSENTKNVTTCYQTSLISASCLSPKGDQKVTVEDTSDISSSKKDQIKTDNTVTTETTDVESLTSLMRNLSPSMRRSFDGSSQKLSTNRSSVSDSPSLARQLCLRGNLSKTVTPPRDHLVLKGSPLELDNTYIMKVAKFSKMIVQSKNRLLNCHRLFSDDKNDLRFIYNFLNGMNALVEIIPDRAYKTELVEIVQDFLDKVFQLRDKVFVWELEVEKDLAVWDDCFKKASKIQLEVIGMCYAQTTNLGPKDFQGWETCLRTVNKKADDMILLRDIKRPTILQFGHELESVIQILIRCLLVLGLIRPSSTVPPD